MDWVSIGQGLMAGIGLTLTAWFGRHLTNARNRAETAKADAEGSLYRLLVDRLETVEGEVKRLTVESAEKDRQIMSLEQHIFHLENAMRAAGIDPPARVYRLGG